MKKYTLFLFLIFTSFIYAQIADSNQLKLNINFQSLPYSDISFKTNKNNFGQVLLNPSMVQSTYLSTDLYSGLHYGVKKLVHFKQKTLNLIAPYIAAGGLDYLVNTLPFGVAWLHEEFHRAVLTRRGITSYNEVYKMKIFQPAIYVSQVTDESLINLSDNFTNDFKRLMMTGSESTNLNIQALQLNNFYYNQRLPNLVFYWLSTIGNLGYMKSSANIKYDANIDLELLAEGTIIENRDFAGPDFTAWVDALFNPNRPYEYRGIHPSGVGINRYIKAGDLAENERSYLNKQGNLQFLNLISPMMFGFRTIKIIDQPEFQLNGNFAFRHGLTPFGNDISLDIYLQTNQLNSMVVFHKYQNKDKHFFGLEANIFDKTIGHDYLKLDLKTILWFQPINLDYYDLNSKIGGLVQVKTNYTKHKIQPHLSLSLKSNGWAAGYLFLERKLDLNIGASIIF